MAETDRPDFGPVRTVGVAVAVAVVSALVVSATAVALKPLQDAHLAAEQAARMEAMLDTLPGLRALMEETGVDALETRMVDLTAGVFAGAAPAEYDMQAAANDPALSIPLAAEEDPARILRRPNLAPVHLLARGGRLEVLVLPVYGTGYAGTIRAYLALEPDLVTIAALTIVEQSETPGLGARIADPAWQALWAGKEIADGAGEVRIAVVRGKGTDVFEVDGIAGATRTGNGITAMLDFWLGDLGYGPFLERLRREGL